MAGVDFQTIITQQAVDYARVVEGGAGKGWHLTPKRFEVSADDSQGFDDTRDLASIDPLKVWHRGTFSTVSPSGTNNLFNNITIPGNTMTTTQPIKEIYFIYENHTNEDDSEFLFAVARPTEPLEFIPGVTVSFKFVFTLQQLNNIESIIDFTYTYPEEISDHNIDLNVHENLVARNGSRDVTGILKYSNDFSDPSSFDNAPDTTLVTKGYVDRQASTAESNANAYTDEKLKKLSAIQVFPSFTGY